MAEFGVPFSLITPAGTLTFNPGGGDGLYLSDITGLDGGDIRSTVDDLPQHDGSMIHRFFRAGMKVTLTGYILPTTPGATRTGLMDNLRGYTDRLIRPTQAELVSTCRLRWTPTGGSDDRILDAVRMFQPVQITNPQAANLKQFEFTLASPYPYTMNFTQHTQAFTSGSTHTLTNAGNTAVYPVFQLTGAFTTASVTNSTTGESVSFVAGSVAGGHYAEINNFEDTVYLDGNSTNLLPNLDLPTTFVRLVPGANSVTFTGAAGTALWNDAFAGG